MRLRSTVSTIQHRKENKIYCNRGSSENQGLSSYLSIYMYLSNTNLVVNSKSVTNASARIKTIYAQKIVLLKIFLYAFLLSGVIV